MRLDIGHPLVTCDDDFRHLQAEVARSVGVITARRSRRWGDC
jgi:hypothetical protein